MSDQPEHHDDAGMHLDPCDRHRVQGLLVMRDLDALYEIADGAKLDSRRRPDCRAWAMPPNIERASAAHKKKKPPKPEAAATKAPVVAVAITPPIASIARPVLGHGGLVETCRQRAIELSLSRAEIDRISGLAPGYSAKILGPDDAIPRKKRMWPQSLELILETLGLAIIIIENPAAAARTISRRVPVQSHQQRFENKCNALPQLAPPLKEPAPASRSHLRVIQGKRRGSKYG
jgi:hypothetical protein